MAKILIVDDNDEIRDVLKLHLSLEGHEILEAENGRAGVDMVGTHGPDLIILDVMMPEMDGFEACRHIHSKPSSAAVYIIMLSAKDQIGDKVSGLDTGADAYLTKPFEPEELKAQVRAGLRTVEDRRRAMYDGLTGLFNRRAFDDLLRRELASVERYGRSLSLVMIDLDHFKAVNDTHGHDAGDAALKDFAELMRAACRPSDLPCRVGGEEFAWLLLETDLDGGAMAAERLRNAIESHTFPGVGSLTASLGVTVTQGAENAETFCKRADAALYRAKEAGRNRIELSAAH